MEREAVTFSDWLDQQEQADFLRIKPQVDQSRELLENILGKYGTPREPLFANEDLMGLSYRYSLLGGGNRAKIDPLLLNLFSEVWTDTVSALPIPGTMTCHVIRTDRDYQVMDESGFEERKVTRDYQVLYSFDEGRFGKIRSVYYPQFSSTVFDTEGEDWRPEKIDSGRLAGLQARLDVSWDARAQLSLLIAQQATSYEIVMRSEIFIP